MKSSFKTQVFQDAYTTADRLAMDFIRYAEQTMEFREKLYIALSGGSTPQTMFSILAKEYARSLPWEKLHFFWVDERCVPAESPESNFGNADRLLFSKISIPKENIHPILGKDDPLCEVVRYTGEILAHVPCVNKFPVFDLIILGMGNDGHTASIFPGQMDLFETNALCSVNEHPETRQKRITLTGKVINNASNVIFLVTGDAKADKVSSIFNNDHLALNYPAHKVKPVNGNLSWYMDSEAAKQLKMEN
ncbi:MAG TPA: 6-phosphogluconolactonase [Bacteroidales bacterium]|nr:6-phosphogluconolactonase [Bacteroidales bacterium]